MPGGSCAARRSRSPRLSVLRSPRQTTTTSPHRPPAGIHLPEVIKRQGVAGHVGSPLSATNDNYISPSASSRHPPTRGHQRQQQGVAGDLGFSALRDKRQLHLPIGLQPPSTYPGSSAASRSRSPRFSALFSATNDNYISPSASSRHPPSRGHQQRGVTGHLGSPLSSPRQTTITSPHPPAFLTVPCRRSSPWPLSSGHLASSLLRSGGSARSSRRSPRDARACRSQPPWSWGP